MSRKLESFIRENREQLDTLEPSPQMWEGIRNAFPGNTPVIKTKLLWFKYLAIGVSVICLAILVGLTLPQEKNETRQGAVQAQLVAENNESLPVNDSVRDSIQSDAPDRKSLSAISSRNTGKSETVQTSASDSMQQAPLAISKILPESNTEENSQTPPRTNLPVSADTLTVIWRSARKSGSPHPLDTTFSGIDEVHVDVPCFDLFVGPAESSELRLHSPLMVFGDQIEMNKQRFLLKYERAGKVLRLKINYTSKDLRYDSSKEHTIYLDLPKGMSVFLVSRIGKIRIKGIQANQLQVEAASGSIELENIASDIHAICSFGRVNANKIEGNINAKITSGNFHLQNALGNVVADNSFGRCELKKVKGKMRVSTASGSQKLEDCEGEAELSTSFGSIQLEDFIGSGTLHAASGGISAKDLQLTGNLSAKSSFGSIHLQLSNKLNELNFNSIATFGSIQLNKEGIRLKESSKLQFGSGKYQVNVTSESGSQILE